MNNTMLSGQECGAVVNNGVMLLDLYERTASSQYSTADSYEGIPIHAHVGLHGHVTELVQRFGALGHGTKAVDLGSGAGALTARLQGLGAEVVALDAVSSNFRASGKNVTFRQCDLNQSFAAEMAQQFQLVMAVEIIEHLENPRAFIRQCKSLLADGGYLLITTPNITSTHSVAELAVKDSFSYFDQSQYTHGGHITPICHWQMIRILDENSLSLVHEGTYGVKRASFRRWPRFFLVECLLGALRPRAIRRDGAISTYLVQKKA